MIYSRWRPDGGYDYFESNGMVPLGDDLPDPVLPPATQLGVPSNEVGHKLPALARRVGQGDLPQGIVVPMDTSRLPVSGLLGNDSSGMYLFVGAAAMGVVWILVELWRRA